MPAPEAKAHRVPLWRDGLAGGAGLQLSQVDLSLDRRKTLYTGNDAVCIGGYIQCSRGLGV